MLFDVNKLKYTNDNLGHIIGNDLICTIANHLMSVFKQDNVFRIGGDEFVVIVKDEDYIICDELIEKCISQMNDLRLSKVPDMKVSCAYGVAHYDSSCDKQFADVLKRADLNMYKNKAQDKNSIR